MNRIIVIGFLIALTGCATTPRSSWQLAYHHDAAGKHIAGSKAALIRAAASGQPVRVVLPVRDTFWHAADAGFLTMMNGELFAQVHAITRQIPNRETRLRIDLDAAGQAQWRAIVATTGEMQAFMSDQGKLNSRQREIKWFVME